jgi:hypothetical protein
MLSHCTGLNAYAQVAAAFPDRCSWPASGSRIRFGKQQTVPPKAPNNAVGSLLPRTSNPGSRMNLPPGNAFPSFGGWDRTAFPGPS